MKHLYLIFILFFIIFSPLWAGDIVLETGRILHKPDFDENEILSELQQNEVESALKNQDIKLIHKEVKPLKNDYHNSFDRGTVTYSEKCKNYAFHKVVIPDGTTIQNCNFTQKETNTKAIKGKNLIFSNCNLTNNDIDESWTLKDSNISQVIIVEDSE